MTLMDISSGNVDKLYIGANLRMDSLPLGSGCENQLRIREFCNRQRAFEQRCRCEACAEARGERLFLGGKIKTEARCDVCLSTTLTACAIVAT
jgi:hypothetical protein